MPSSALVAVATCLPEESRSSSVTPGRPSSPCSTFPVLPPPGLKSLQTTPVMPSGLAGGFTACLAPSGTSSGEIADRPSTATLPGSSGVFSVSVLPGLPTSCGVDGSAEGKAPCGSNTPLTAAIAALTVPWLGSWMYIRRQITPAASSEIAIGMNTTVLNATDQRTRSVRTAKISPSAVTKTGTIATHSTLFLIAVSSRSVVKSSLKFANQTKCFPVASKKLRMIVRIAG